MTRVALITDSAACLPPNLVEEYGIEVVPLSLVLEGKVYPDQADGDNHQFYDHLKTSRRLPTTASPSPGDYLEALRRAAGRADAALCITVSRRFSATYESAVQAAEKAPVEVPALQVKVIDSGAATMAQGFMVLEAARAAAGDGLEAAAGRAEALKPRVGIIAILDTLDYLARGGRVPRAAAWASSLLQIKPIVEFSRDSVRLIGRVRIRRRAYERLYTLMKERAAGSPSLHLCVHHADAPEEAEALAGWARSALDPVELYVSEFTRVMSAHTGPGLLGFAYYLD
jgi:DegV family protein with EDD domain